MSEKEQRDGYVRKDIYETEKGSQKAMCIAKHAGVDRDIKDLQDSQKSINRKITATLVFTIITLISIVVAIGTRALV